jgi:cytosine/adenosine deaminase-related metal-dependent hydrolase
VYHAAWVLPIAGPPLRQGLVAIGDGQVLGVTGKATRGDFLTAWSTHASDVVDLGDCAILPGLVNSHTHLELSWMRDRVPPGGSMPEWAARLVRLRGTVGDGPVAAVDEAAREARAAGTSLVGDVTNTLTACRAMLTSGLGGAVFREVLGFAAREPEELVADAWSRLRTATSPTRLRASLVPHAPYSVSPALFRAIAASAGDLPMSVHLGESAEELQFLRDGTGAWRELLVRLGAWTDDWDPPGCGPVEYLDRLGFVNDRLLAVHGTQLTDAELRRLAAAGSTLVTCPRSNRWTGAGVPPIERFYASGVRVAIGTDSLASVEDLNPFAELAEIRRLSPGVPASQLLQSATIHGAVALGFGAEFGTIEPGKRADLIAVQIPAGLEDVEEYLLNGIEPAAIAWLE